MSIPSRTWAFSTPRQPSPLLSRELIPWPDYHTLSRSTKMLCPLPGFSLFHLKKAQHIKVCHFPIIKTSNPKVFTYSFCPIRMEENPFSFQRPAHRLRIIKFFLLYLFHPELALPDSPSPKISPADMHYYLFLKGSNLSVSSYCPISLFSSAKCSKRAISPSHFLLLSFQSIFVSQVSSSQVH